MGKKDMKHQSKLRQKPKKKNICAYNFTIYNSPEDFPGQLVGRMFKIDSTGVNPMDEAMIMPDTSRESLEELRTYARKKGLTHRLPRDRHDVLSIMEVWI